MLESLIKTDISCYGGGGGEEDDNDATDHVITINYYKRRLDCEVFSANRIDRIEPLLAQPHKETQLPSN